MPELLPCPFCGSSESVKLGFPFKDYVYCAKCDAFGPTGQDGDEATRLWNTRADSYTPSDPKADYEAER